MGITGIIGITYAVGFFGSMLVYRKRAGIGNWYMVPKDDRFAFLVTNIGWLAVIVVKAYWWPIVLAVWLAKGRQSSLWQVQDYNADILKIRRLKRPAPGVAGPIEGEVVATGNRSA